MDGVFPMKLITVNHYHIHRTLVTSRKSLGQRSRSFSYGGDRNLVKSIAPEPLKGCQQILHRCFLWSGYDLIKFSRSSVQK